MRMRHDSLNMQLLALDTSQGMTSLAFAREGKVISTFKDVALNNQAAQLVSQCEQFMQAHGVQWQELDAIACTTGPGGFTSVRIGVAAARGFGFAAAVPAYGVAVPEVMAHYAFTHAETAQIMAVLPAGRQDAAWQRFALKSGKHYAMTDMRLAPVEELTRIAGDVPVCMPEGWHAVPQTKSIGFPVADMAEHLARYLLRYGLEESYASPAPVYARPPDAAVGKPLLG